MNLLNILLNFPLFKKSQQIIKGGKQNARKQSICCGSEQRLLCELKSKLIKLKTKISNIFFKQAHDSKKYKAP